MKTSLPKTQAAQKINEFFKRKTFLPEQVKKIKRLAMKHNIKLKEKKRLFCKSCLSKLKGKTKISKTHKTINCINCNYKNCWKIN